MANNQYVNKVEFGNDTLIDISDTTAEAGDVLEGAVFYTKSGAPATGTLGDATTSTHGLMSAADKIKLNSLSNTTIDATLTTSGAAADALTVGTQLGNIASQMNDFEINNIELTSMFGQGVIRNKDIPGDNTYHPLIKMNLRNGVAYTMAVKLKAAISQEIYVALQQENGTTIGYSSTLFDGDTFLFKLVNASADYTNARFAIKGTVPFSIDYAIMLSSDNLLTQLADTVIGDDITMLTTTSENYKLLDSDGVLTATSDFTYYVTDEIEIKPCHWYMVTATAGYSNSYYAIMDENHNIIYNKKSPGGSTTAIINKVIYTPPQSKYIRIAYASSSSGGHIALCNSLKSRTIIRPEWFGKFLKISYSALGVATINTRETYFTAGHFGFNACKGDVRPTSDGKLIMCHDPGFTFNASDRITTYDASNATSIAGITRAAALEYEYAGFAESSYNNYYQRVCDIDEYLDICKQYDMIAFITIRDEYISTVCAEVIAALKRHDMQNRAIINSYTHTALSYIRMLDSSIPISFVMADNYNLNDAAVNLRASYGNAIVTLVSTSSNMKTYIGGLSSVIANAHAKGLGIMYAQPTTTSDVNWLRAHGICGVQIGACCMPYQFTQYKFKLVIDDSTPTIAEWGGANMIDATITTSSNTITITSFCDNGSDRDIPDLIPNVWMNQFLHRITVVSENGSNVAATWTNNGLNITVDDISVDDIIDIIIEV